MTNDALIEEINGAYRQLSGATEALARADRSLAELVHRIRLDNVEAILEAKNERTASLYLDGLLDTDEHRRLEAARARAPRRPCSSPRPGARRGTGSEASLRRRAF